MKAISNTEKAIYLLLILLSLGAIGLVLVAPDYFGDVNAVYQGF